LGKLKILVLVLLVAAAGGAAYYYRVYIPNHPAILEIAYVLPSSVSVLDSRAEIHLVIGVLKNGDRVEVLSREDDWVRVRLTTGLKGWLEADDLTDAQAHEEGLRLLKDLEGIPAQALGHTSFTVNLRVQPSRDGSVLAQLPQNQSLEVYGRRLVERESESQDAGAKSASIAKQPAAAPRDAWYLVRTDSRAGWVYGRLVSLDIPSDIANYGESTNIVAWLVLNKVDDEGRKMPQYLVAERNTTQDCDFDRIRVFTWWAAQDHFATAFVEGRLNGYFPIQVSTEGNTPYFRLRLVDAKGRKFQKVYRLEDTIVRSAGTVEGWVSAAMPAAESPRSRRRR
jgi:Bacterial SH3 domain